MRAGLVDTFRGKIVMITGAGSGLGRALAMQLASYGSIVVATDVDEASIESLARDTASHGGIVEAARLDVTDSLHVASEIAALVRRYSRIDFIFNCAGIGLKGEIRDMSEEQWRNLIDINLWGVIHCTNAAYKVMLNQGSGHIINIASLAGLVPVPGIVAYGAVKHAVVGLSTALRAEGADLGVRVTAVCPGPIATGFQRNMIRVGYKENDEGKTRSGMHPSLAALEILDGVARNRSIVVFPLRARVTWMLYRYLPAGVVGIQRGIVLKLRKKRESAPEFS